MQRKNKPTHLCSYLRQIPLLTFWCISFYICFLSLEREEYVPMYICAHLCMHICMYIVCLYIHAYMFDSLLWFYLTLYCEHFIGQLKSLENAFGAWNKSVQCQVLEPRPWESQACLVCSEGSPQQTRPCHLICLPDGSCCKEKCPLHQLQCSGEIWPDGS